MTKTEKEEIKESVRDLVGVLAEKDKEIERLKELVEKAWYENHSPHLIKYYPASTKKDFEQFKKENNLQ